MRNKIEDVRNHLIACMERLNEEQLSPEQISAEVARAKAMANLGQAVVETAKVEVLHMAQLEKMGYDVVPSDFIGNQHKQLEA